MQKIIKLITDADFYAERALDKAGEGDFFGALELLRHAQNFVKKKYDEQDLSIKLEIADLLADLGLYEDSTLEYLKLIPHDFCLEEIFYGIIKNYALLENSALASYFLRLGASLGILLPEENFEPEELEYLEALPMHKSEIKLLKPNDNSHTISVAKHLLTAHDIDFARQVLMTVPKTSLQHTEATNYLALIELSEGRGEQGLAMCRQILKDNPDDFYALTTEIIALEMSGKITELDKKIIELDKIDLDEMPAVAKAALCFCQINNSAYAHKYLQRTLKYLPYDKEILALAMLAASNMGEYKLAKDAAVRLTVLYKDDPVVSYYARRVEDCIKEPTNYLLLPDLPKSVRMSNAKLLDKTVYTLKCADKLMLMANKDTQLAEAINYALYSNNDSLSVQIGTLLALSKKAEPLLRDVLIDPDFSPLAKKEILIALFHRGNLSAPLHLFVNSQLFFLYPKIPKELQRPEIIEAYWQVYGALCFLGDGEDTKNLNRVAKKVNASLKSLPQINERAVAALIAYKASSHKVFEKVTHICEIFRCELQELEEYEKLLGASIDKK